MGTRGLQAYLYKIWITSLIEQIEREVRWRSELNILDEEQLETDSDDDDLCVALYEGRPVLFQDITGIDEGMISVDGFNEIIEWSYVVDLDNRAFTINGRMHFRLDNMPPGSLNKYFWRAPDPHYPGSSCIPTFAHPPSTPIEYIATVSRWPPPDFDISQAHEDYNQLAPLLLSIEEWGAPTWTNLTTSQRLSESLVQVILRDNAEKLSNPDVVETRPDFGVCLWQLISAAAPSYLRCPPVPDPSVNDSAGKPLVLCISELEATSGRLSCVTPHYDKLDGGNLDHMFHWFRGCLVMFCPRIDDVEYVEYETVLMVNNIRNYGRSTGIGIIFSGRHILAVAVDDNIVRCSQPLFFHDAKKNIMDSFLLATHLLSPHLTTNKLPWMQTSLERAVIGGLNSKLPYELAREIAFYLDHDL
ncbi:hypothetical protein FRC09_004632 [Ceratobasidium sp. 395]|nr:hypothetical protein FRC09_004632 [Ceratobasidium sp. 395]